MGLIRKMIASRRARRRSSVAKKPGAKDVDYVASMYGLGEAKARMGNVDDAVSCWTRAVLVSRKRSAEGRAPASAETAQCLVGIGDSFMAHGMWDEALAAWNEALQVQRGVLDDEWHPDVARILNKIGMAFSYSKAEGDHTYTALTAFEKALEIQQDTLGPGHEDCAETANNMCKLLDEFRARESEAEGAASAREGDSSELKNAIEDNGMDLEKTVEIVVEEEEASSSDEDDDSIQHSAQKVSEGQEEAGERSEGNKGPSFEEIIASIEPKKTTGTRRSSNLVLLRKQVDLTKSFEVSLEGSIEISVEDEATVTSSDEEGSVELIAERFQPHTIAQH